MKFELPSIDTPDNVRSFCERNRLVYCGIRSPRGTDLNGTGMSQELWEAVNQLDPKPRVWILPISEDPSADYHVLIPVSIFKES